MITFQRILTLVLLCFLGYQGRISAQSGPDTTQYAVSVQVFSRADSTPLAAADVMIKGKNSGSVTDEAGKVLIKLLKQDSIVLITAPGYLPEEINVFLNEALDVKVYLMKDVELRDRGYQVKYGVPVFPGSRQEISGKVFGQGYYGSLEHGLQGRVSGLHAVQSSGNINAYTSVLIRGIGTSVLGTEPLYEIDGVPVVSGAYGDGGAGIGNDYGYQTSPLAEFNLSDIASVDVLKGGAATALYGGRGANGVIRVQTKRGKAGKTRLSVGYQAGVSAATNQLKLLDGPGYLRAMDAAFSRSFYSNPANTGQPLPERDFYLSNPSNPYITNDVASATNTDWMSSILRNGSTRQLDLSASGGNKLVRFFFGGSYQQAKGIIQNNENNRLSIRFNTDVSVSPSFRFGSSLFFSFSQGFVQPSGNSGLGGGFGDAQTAALPINPVRFDSRNDFLNPYRSFNPYFNAYNGTNIALLTDQTHSQFDRQVFRNIGNIYAEADIKGIPGLKVRGDFNFDYYSNFDRAYRSSFTRLGLSINLEDSLEIVPSSAASDNRSVFFNLGGSGTISYQKQIDQHGLRFFGGYSLTNLTNTYNGVSSENFPSSYSKLVSFGSRFAGLPIGAETGFGFATQFYGVDYDWNKKYFLNLSTSLTASTRYGKDIGFVPFPSASIGWDLKKEPFMQQVSWLNAARVTVASSLTGNSLMTNNQASGYWKGNLPYVDQGQYPGRYPSTLASTKLEPEKNWVNELQIQASAFECVVSGSIGVFERRTLNAIQFYPFAPSQGLDGNSFVLNGAEIVNRGIELELQTRNLKRGKFEWRTQIQWAGLKNEVVSSDGLNQDQVNAFLGAASIEGQSVSGFYLPRWAGFASVDDPQGRWLKGDELILDKNGNPFKPETLEEIDAARVAIKDKSALPKWYGGIQNQLTWGRFQLDFLFTFSLGNYILDAGERYQSYMTGNSNLRTSAVDDNLYFLGADTALGYRVNLLSQRNTTRFLHDASYVRLKQLGLTYTLNGLPGFFARLNDARVFVQGQNLLTFTKFQGWDPEAQTNSFLPASRALAHGSAFFNVPQFRSLLLGISLNF